MFENLLRILPGSIEGKIFSNDQLILIMSYSDIFLELKNHFSFKNHQLTRLDFKYIEIIKV